MDNEKAVLLEHLEIVKNYIDNKDAENIKSAEFVDDTLKFYTSEDKSGEAVAEITLPEETFLDGSKTELVSDFSWSSTKYPKSVNPELNGKAVLVLAVKSGRTIRYSFISLDSVITRLVGGDTDGASISVTNDVVTLSVKVSELSDNRVVLKDDGLYVATVDNTPTWTVSTDDEISALFPLSDAPGISADSLGAREVGNVVKIMENGVPTNFIVVHKGNPDTEMYDASCDGVWLLRETVSEEKIWNSESSNDYCLSTMNNYLSVDYYNKIDENVRKAIKQVKIPITHWGHADAMNDLTVSCNIFLLSGYEVGAGKNSPQWLSKEGSKLSFFLEGWKDSIANAKRVCYNDNGSSVPWWTRSRYNLHGTMAYYCETVGKLDSGLVKSNSFGVRPAFILPYDVAVDSNSLVIG